MSIPIPKDAACRIVSGMPALNIIDEEDLEVVENLITQCIMEGEWLIELGLDGTSVGYEILCMLDSMSIEAVIKKMEYHFYFEMNDGACTEGWIGLIPLIDWSYVKPIT